MRGYSGKSCEHGKEPYGLQKVQNLLRSWGNISFLSNQVYIADHKKKGGGAMVQ